MKITFNKFKYILPFIIVFFSSEVFSGETLDENKVKSLIIGNTVFAKHLKKDFEFKVYFDVDGTTAHRNQNGETVKTTYKFDGNKHCIFWKDKDRCATIQDTGNGSYSRVNAKGKSVVTWSKVVKGNKL